MDAFARPTARRRWWVRGLFTAIVVALVVSLAWTAARDTGDIPYGLSLVIPGLVLVLVTFTDDVEGWALLGGAGAVLAAVAGGFYWVVFQWELAAQDSGQIMTDADWAANNVIIMWVLLGGAARLTARMRTIDHEQKIQAWRERVDAHRYSELSRATRHAGAGTRALTVTLSAAALLIAVTGRAHRRT